MHDLILKNGLVIDGVGTPAYRADVAVADGKIVAIGALDAPAARVIDASGLVVAPGFIDPHTHYDAQLCWDSAFTCSSWHGVTTVIMGHCGVGLAPCKPEARRAVAMDLVTIESIPIEVLDAGVTWDWVTFGDYMTAAANRGLGINAGFMAPLTPFRRWVLGDAATERAATPDETTQIAALLREAIEEGALGFSTTFLRHHFGDGGKPLACRLASREELSAYCNVLRSLKTGAIELALTETGIITDYEHDILERLVADSERPVTWVFLLARDDKPETSFESLERTAALIAKRCLPQVMPTPLTIQFDLHAPAISLANMPCWKPLFGQSIEEQRATYADPAFRAAYRIDLKKWGLDWPWDRTVVSEVGAPALKPLVGRSVAAIAAEWGRDVIDTFLDIAVEDQLKTRYNVALFNIDLARVGALITDPRTLLGLSDAGAHIDVFCTADYPTHLLGAWVREMKVMTLEHAIKRITSEPAAFFGIKDRGQLAPGMAADIVVFDAATIDSTLRPEMVHDFPGGLGRLVTRAKGIRYTFVNGVSILEDGVPTGALPGQVVRSTPDRTEESG